MSAARSRRAARRGYTLIEVMAALGVLAIGATGVLALQKATLISSTNARNLAIANNIAVTWAERLRADALQWNNFSDPSDLASDTRWLGLSTLTAFPERVTPADIPALGARVADVMGTDIYEGDPAQPAFCTHLRFRQFSEDTATSELRWQDLIRIEIRVVWERSGNPIDCDDTALAGDAPPDRYGAVYLTSSVLRNTTQGWIR